SYPRRRRARGALFRATLTAALAALAFFDAFTPPAGAQQPRATRAFHVREPIGIRRTEYPVSVRIPFPKGALASAAQVRLTLNGADVPAQFLASALWDDGSVQSLDVDLNVSLDPEEDRRFELQYGEGVAP